MYVWSSHLITQKNKSYICEKWVYLSMESPPPPPPPPPPRWERVNWSICYLSSLIAISLPWQLNWLLFLIKVPYYYTIYACVSPSFTNSQNKCKKHSVGNLLHGVMVTFTARGWGNTFVLNGKKRLHKNRFLKGQDTMTHLTVLC